MRRYTPLLIAAVASTVTSSPGSGQEALCEGAERFVRETMGMVAIAEADTIDDWRTRRTVHGCRVTAAGASSLPSVEIVRSFYQVIAESDWVRTPDPRDAPNEASLRFRRDGVDCLFNYYDSAMSLNTDAEMMVSDAVYVGRNEKLYNFLVLCMPAAPAAPRG
ncbi:MAG: hypothetical protein OXU33_02265 [Gemmatimonadota bacterium]|nr:hypothetical protein [Gemmatimonadota bacterium]MDE3004713.1 hypothetical protein [Gemmatimonadota bacterium]MDE3012870.1 hypothetical protein [Gemmatimonadota bacterium]